MVLYTRQIDTPFGPLGIVASDQGVVVVQWQPDAPDSEAWLARTFAGARFRPQSNAVADQSAAELADYFGRRRQVLEAPVHLIGTPFQLRVWEAVRTVPFGQTITYGEIAAALRTGPRAVGGAIARTAASLYVPCHRVVAAGGLGGYGGEERRKRRLLRFEGVAGY